MFDDLTQNDINSIARMHLESLPDDIIPMLGINYLKKIYSYFLKSENEKIFVKRDLSGEIQSVCIITFSIDTFFFRIVKNTFITLFFCSIKQIFTSLKFNILLFNFVKYFFKNNSEQNNFNPQIAFLFTNVKTFGHGFGTALLDDVETYLSVNKNRKLYTKTIYNNKNKAINFYNKNNFEIIDKTRFAGREYLYMIKNLKIKNSG